MLGTKELNAFALLFVDPPPHVETCQIDFSLRSVGVLRTDVHPTLLRESRVTADYEPLPCDAVEQWRLTPGRPYVFTTEETVRMPAQHFGVLRPRRTVFMSGLILCCTNVSPGYMGRLTMVAHSMLQTVVTVQRGFRFASMFVLGVESEEYKGFWQGGLTISTGVTPAPPQ